MCLHFRSSFRSDIAIHFQDSDFKTYNPKSKASDLSCHSLSGLDIATNRDIIGIALANLVACSSFLTESLTEFAAVTLFLLLIAVVFAQQKLLGKLD
ncbi:hypothetical protein U1Q18_001364 [Sarracenia purpurea var. burkii]